MFEVENLSASYGLHRALDRVSLNVGESEVVVMLGANGAGKTTMLKAIAGLLPTPLDTRIALAGRAVQSLPARLRVEAGIALVPEGRGIFGDLSVHENLSLGAYPQRARAGEKPNLGRVLALFPRLAERLKQTARTMSGGEQQMVAIGRALMSAPRLLLLDEPSLGLSPLVCKELFRVLERVKETGVSILLVEQNARRSLAIADRGYVLENGRIAGEGQARQLLDDPAVQSAYLGIRNTAA
ncbi:MAG: ABC transporter ATP-binding protein [Burkholderiaceae bacterium]|jgi:branched-chain amino acid transport system ATP-binding protein|nr:ABC transporter ATP-binding protein [Burkholderiaceae bacterium]